MLEIIFGRAPLSGGIEIRSSVELPSHREAITLHTEDGLDLVAELATPIDKPPLATIIALHPLPTHGGFMDSHVLRKAANRLPELASIAVLRFNTRGTGSPHGKSEGDFDHGNSERFDVAAAVAFAKHRGLPNLWLVGWSFGTELALKYGIDEDVLGAVLLSPPLHRTSVDELSRWAHSDKELIAIVPEFDDYLKPDEARERFSVIPEAKIIGIDGAKHLWVGESATTSVLNEIVRVINPAAYPLPEVWLPV